MEQWTGSGEGVGKTHTLILHRKVKLASGISMNNICFRLSKKMTVNFTKVVEIFSSAFLHQW